MATNADNVLGFGSDDDSLYLGAYDPDLASKVTGLHTSLPEGMEDCGWINEDGVSLVFDDSVTKIKGHQGHGVVRTFMDSSETSITASLLESRVSIVTRYLNAVAERLTEDGEAVAKLTAKAQRGVTLLSGVWDAFDTASTTNPVKMRIVIPRLELGERGEIAFKVGELTAYNHTLNITSDYIVYTNHRPMIPAGDDAAPAAQDDAAPAVDPVVPAPAPTPADEAAAPVVTPADDADEADPAAAQTPAVAPGDDEDGQG